MTDLATPRATAAPFGPEKRDAAKKGMQFEADPIGELGRARKGFAWVRFKDFLRCGLAAVPTLRAPMLAQFEQSKAPAVCESLTVACVRASVVLWPVVKGGSIVLLIGPFFLAGWVLPGKGRYSLKLS